MKRILPAIALLCAATSATALSSMTFSVTATLTFPAANPDTTPIVAGSNSVTATIFIKNPQKESVTLTVQANGASLVSGAGDTIPVGNVTWDAVSATWTWSSNPKPQPYWNPEQGPQALTTSAVTVVSGNDGQAPGPSDTSTGTVTSNFTFQNSWAYSTGAYTQTVTWTVTAI